MSSPSMCSLLTILCDESTYNKSNSSKIDNLLVLQWLLLAGFAGLLSEYEILLAKFTSLLANLHILLSYLTN